MAECPRCHAPVTAAQVDGKVIPLDNHESAIGRYRFIITDFETEPWTAESIDPSTAVLAYTDHRKTCLLS